jgi:hypothetical protein
VWASAINRLPRTSELVKLEIALSVLDYTRSYGHFDLGLLGQTELDLEIPWVHLGAKPYHNGS